MTLFYTFFCLTLYYEQYIVIFLCQYIYNYLIITT